MENPKNAGHLFADQGFQDDVLDPGKAKGTLLEKYPVSEQELTEARKMFRTLSFVRKASDPAEISYARSKLLGRIASSGKSRKGAAVIRIISRVAAVLTLPLLFSTLYLYWYPVSPQAIFHAEARTLTYRAEAGVKTEFSLPDGSLVWLNSGSTLSCPSVFDRNLRQVELHGEAYFEVVKSSSPMIVSAGPVQVRVYGTRFNLQAYDDEPVVTATLVEGKISLVTEEKEKEYFLDPGFSASYFPENTSFRLAKVEKMDVFTGWKDGKLLFDNEPFAEVLRKMERWYNVDIRLNDPALGSKVLYATFIDENVEQVLDILSKSIPITVRYPERVKNDDGSYAKRTILIERSN